MPTFQVEHPDGSQWEIDADDPKMAADALLSHRPVSWTDAARDALKSIPFGATTGAVAPAYDWAKVQQEQDEAGQPWNWQNVSERLPPTENVVGAATQNMHQPMTGLGRIAAGTAGAVTNPFSWAGGSPGGNLGLAILQGSGGAAAAEPFRGTPYEAPAAFAGGAAAGFLPGLTRAAAFPNRATEQHMQDVNVLKREGIPLTAGDETGNKTFRAAELELSPRSNEDQKKAFVQAAFNKVGENVGDRRVTGPDGAIDTMMRRTGQRFDELQGNHAAEFDPQTIADFKNIHDTYHGVPGLYSDEVKSAVNGAITRIMNVSEHNGGVIAGKEYQTLRSDLNKAAMGADGQKSAALHSVVDKLDDTMERSIARNDPEQAGEWAKARRDYRNALVLQKWGNSTDLTPAALAQAAKQVYGPNAYVRGKDDFSELAEAAKRVIPEYRTSETTRRNVVENATQGISTVLGAALGHHMGDMQGGLEGGVLGYLLGEKAGNLAVRPAARGVLMSDTIQNYLKRQAPSWLPAPQQPKSSLLAKALAQTQGNSNP